MKYNLIPIKKIDTYETNDTIVYDLTVENNHSYCVDNNIIVHNSGCTSRNATGMYYPYISLLLECIYYSDKLLIADGGIKESQDFCKAIAAGADFIILGNLIAKCKESPAEIINRDGKQYKLYHGSASYENQSFYKAVPKYIEGK